MIAILFEIQEEMNSTLTHNLTSLFSYYSINKVNGEKMRLDFQQA